MVESGRLQSMGLLESDTTERLHFHFSLSCVGEGSGNPLQCSCLKNPRNGEAWRAAVYGVAQSRTRLKQLSSSSSSSSSSVLEHFLILPQHPQSLPAVQDQFEVIAEWPCSQFAAARSLVSFYGVLMSGSSTSLRTHLRVVFLVI